MELLLLLAANSGRLVPRSALVERMGRRTTSWTQMAPSTRPSANFAWPWATAWKSRVSSRR